MRILTPNAEFAQKDAPQPDPPYYGNEGVRRLETTVKASGPVTIAVQFSPEWEDGTSEAAQAAPISSW